MLTDPQKYSGSVVLGLMRVLALTVLRNDDQTLLARTSEGYVQVQVEHNAHRRRTCYFFSEKGASYNARSSMKAGCQQHAGSKQLR